MFPEWTDYANFPLLLAAAPLKRVPEVDDDLWGCQFSAAFSGGPIEAASSPTRSRALATYFPLLLAAAPLKLVTWAARRLDEKEFSAAFSGGPIEAHMSIVP